MSRDPIQKLLFVYNADSGLGNGVLDAAHKVLDPGTYDCKLCELTYGVLLEKPDWKRFRKQCPVSMEFLHRDEFLKEYASKFLPAYTFPVVLELTAYEMDIFMGTGEINLLSRTGQLIEEIEKRLSD